MDRKVTTRSRRAPAEQAAASTGLRRSRPRDYEEWKALVRWNKLPAWEPSAPGYQLRLARESAGLRQVELAKRLGVSQQAVARAERWNSNPTLRFVEGWAQALGATVEVVIRLRERIS